MRNTGRSWLLLAALLVTGVTALAYYGAGRVLAVPTPTEQSQELLAAYDMFRSDIASLQRMDFKAEFAIRLHSPDGGEIVGGAVYHHVQDGDRYRIECSRDPYLPLSRSVTLAFDGVKSYLAFPEDRVVSVRTGDVDILGCPTFNPLLLPFDHLGLNAKEVTRLNDGKLWGERTHAIPNGLAGVRSGGQVPGLSLARFEQGRSSRKAVNVVEFQSVEGSQYLVPSYIEVRQSHDTTDARFDFATYTAHVHPNRGTFLFPSEMTVRVWKGDRLEPVLSAVIHISRFDTVGIPDPDEFRVDVDSSWKVWDDDRQAFVFD